MRAPKLDVLGLPALDVRPASLSWEGIGDLLANHAQRLVGPGATVEELRNANARVRAAYPALAERYDGKQPIDEIRRAGVHVVRGLTQADHRAEVARRVGDYIRDRGLDPVKDYRAALTAVLDADAFLKRGYTGVD